MFFFLTVFRFEFKGIIDYIFYSKQSMVPLGLLGPLSPEWLKDNKVVGCPHPHVPSGKFRFHTAILLIKLSRGIAATIRR